MRPALQRLLARPSSINLLRHLVRTYGCEVSNTPTNYGSNCSCKSSPSIHCYSTIALGFQDNQNCESPERHGSESTKLSTAVQHEPKFSTITPKWVEYDVPRTLLNYGLWKESMWTEEQLEFESNLADHDRSKGRLLDHPAHVNDMNLWACLLNYRQRRYGSIATQMFWEAICCRGITIPTKGPMADYFWRGFLDAGLHGDIKLVGTVVAYADKLLESTGRRWGRLYETVITHFLLAKQSGEAIKWHHHLFERHPPGARSFAHMCNKAINFKGDMAALRQIYLETTYRNLYRNIVPKLCETHEFGRAIEWHFTLLKYGDLPQTSRVVEPLVHYLAIYNRNMAIKVTRSLVKANVSFAPDLDATTRSDPLISREMMNLVHGEMHHIKVKTYNDELGARWFATLWVSLDVAINTIHALGFQEIGPLSLQAIALREPEADSVVRRIEQLKNLGISIGKSVFSRALADFAQNKKHEYLKGLLESDQHPDALEDHELQFKLLNAYAAANDWASFQRTFAVRLIGRTSPDIESQNLFLEIYATQGDVASLLATLSKMHTQGIPVKTRTISTILRHILRPRRRGHRPITQVGVQDLNMAVDILKGIMAAGSFVPASFWREILVRLGMLARGDDLDKLCIYLASYYKPGGNGLPFVTWTSKRMQIPASLPTNHPLHPLKILFSVKMQKAIVEWGFIRAVGTRRISTKREASAQPSVAAGIILLQQLRRLKVDIDSAAVRKAIVNRLVLYYGPGFSENKMVRLARARNTMTLEEMVQQVDDALGTTAFPGIDMKEYIRLRASVRMRRSTYVNRKVMLPDSSPRPHYSSGFTY